MSFEVLDHPDHQDPITTLAQRVTALEGTLAEYRRALEAILASAPMKMTGLRPGELLAASRLTTTPTEQREVKKDNVHPADQAIKAGSKLRALAGELQR